MKDLIYSTTVVKIGASALMFLSEKMLIFFNKRAHSDLAEYSVLIDDGEGGFNIETGDYLVLGNAQYRITAIGDVATRNFEMLGHVVVRFDGKDVAALPGNFHVENKEIAPITENMTISFVKK